MYRFARHPTATYRAVFASVLLFVWVAMQSMAALHRGLHGNQTPNSLHSQSEMQWLHATHHDHDDAVENHHRSAHNAGSILREHTFALDPWFDHTAVDCEHFDASLCADPATAAPQLNDLLRIQRAAVSRDIAAAIVLRAQRARVRDPPLV